MLALLQPMLWRVCKRMNELRKVAAFLVPSTVTLPRPLLAIASTALR